jgi:hypothetical protein
MARDRSTLEQVEVSAHELTDRQLCTLIRLYGEMTVSETLPPAVRRFHSAIVEQLAHVLAWRSETLWMHDPELNPDVGADL